MRKFADINVKRYVFLVLKIIFPLGGVFIGGYIGAKIGKVAGSILLGAIGFMEGVFLESDLEYKINRYLQSKA